MRWDVPMVLVHIHWDIMMEIELVLLGCPDTFLTTSAFQKKEKPHTFQVLKKILQLHNTTHELSLILGGVFPLYVPN